MPKRTDISKILIAIVGLSFASVALACTRVVVADGFETRNMRYELTWEGKLLEGARVDIYLDKKPRNSTAPSLLTITTKSDGQVFLQNLQPGTYEMIVNIPDRPAISSEIHISESAGQGTTVLGYELDAAWLKGDASFLTKLPTQAWVNNLHGVVMDESGGVVTKAIVRVYSVTGESAGGVVEQTTDSHGEFVFALPNGKYVVTITFSGFRPSGIPLEISPNGWEGFKAMLKVASTDNCSPAVLDSTVKLEALNR